MLNFTLPAIQIAIAIFLVPASETVEKFSWPNGKKAAICLTYDDGLSSQVTSALSMLNKHKIKASFYPTLASSSVYSEMEKWKALASEGRELGNHAIYTMSHHGHPMATPETNLSRTSNKSSPEIR